MPLRLVDPDADIHQQIERTVERLVKEHLSWGDLCRASDTTKVVLLDGFDELVQATGVTQSHYIERVARFQREEWINGRPVIVVITSRTLVMDRTVVPPETVVLKLEPFDTAQIERWADAWNTANANRPGFRELGVDELARHEDLAGQPLLLMMLAVYAAESGARLDDEQLNADELYRRLLDTFIGRQIREKGPEALGDLRFAELEQAARHDLSVAAFAMFNRGRQYVSEEDLERDLDALHPIADAPGGHTGEPLTRAKRTVAAFFFVHVAQSGDDVRVPGRRTYEFLHATFAEYLVAEHTVDLLQELLHDWRRPRRTYGAHLDDAGLRDLLSHQPLTNGEQIAPFLRALLERLPAEDRADLRNALVELLGAARKRVDESPYCPTPFDIVTRLAAYSANLVILAALCDRDGVEVALLPDFASLVRLWRSLDAETQTDLFVNLERKHGRIRFYGRSFSSLAMAEARLVGDFHTEETISAGQVTLPSESSGITATQCRLHVLLVKLLADIWPVPQLGRLLPYDELALLNWVEEVEHADESLHHATGVMLMQALLRDGPAVSDATLARLVGAIPDLDAPQDQPARVWLLLRHPHVLSGHPRFGDDPVDQLALVRQVARRSPDSAERDRILGYSLPPSVFKYEVAPSMVTDFIAEPHIMPSVLEQLVEFGDLAWSQVRPRDLLAAVRIVDGEVRQSAVVSYVECRAAAVFEGEDAEAFELLREMRQA
ncbi:NACHT domain-containing protein [Dactylosporangium sp. CS-033363]|uniref:NACHT domain-containing protein n=1 Tax=Dactylosporangium sp. CS-033363 TaxID=3239935 RepID=UPI003D936B5E